MKVENLEVWGFEHAIRGMRNPKKSWSRSDSHYKSVFNENKHLNENMFILGDNDLKLAKALVLGGSEHRKFLRQIFVSFDLTAPIYVWKEFDTYKIGTTSNSESTMHTITKEQITWDSFEFDDFVNIETPNTPYKDLKEYYDRTIDMLEWLRSMYVSTNEIKYWKELIRALPESWEQKRTITLSYENLFNMHNQREFHKLTE